MGLWHISNEIIIIISSGWTRNFFNQILKLQSHLRRYRIAWMTVIFNILIIIISLNCHEISRTHSKLFKELIGKILDNLIKIANSVYFYWNLQSTAYEKMMQPVHRYWNLTFSKKVVKCKVFSTQIYNLQGLKFLCNPITW